MELIDYLTKQAKAAMADNEFCNAIKGLTCGLVIEITEGVGSVVVIPIEGRDDKAIILRASAIIWGNIILPKPPIGFHSFTAALRQQQEFKIEGTKLQIAQSLHALERLFEILRGQIADEDPQAYPDLQHIRGSYGYVNLGNERVAQIYYEESGNAEAPTLLMLHTAGADARQFHPIMADIDLRKQWNMVAFDLPSHGRSMPLLKALWQDYSLTKEDYVNVCQVFIEQIIGRPVVLLGCSMGAAMALKMAATFPNLVSGVIALEAPFRSVGRRTDMLTNPQVNQAAHNPSYVRGLMSPSSPLSGRRAAAWIYSQGGFQVYSGDLVFYSDEFDAAVDLVGIDGIAKGITLLTGSYDYSATPADSQKVAALIPGARFTLMPDIGHFPMIENPKRLIEYMKPELAYVFSKFKKV